MERRNFIKLFGAGTAIVPVVSGLPMLAAEAKLLEAPKVEIFDEIPSSFGTVKGSGGGPLGITVIYEMANGKRLVLTGKTFVTSIETGWRDLYSWSWGRNTPVDTVKTQSRLKYKLEGEIFGEHQVETLFEMQNF